MSTRSDGLRRANLVTTVLAAASVTGVVVVGAIVAHPTHATSGTTGTPSVSTGGSDDSNGSSEGNWPENSTGDDNDSSGVQQPAQQQQVQQPVLQAPAFQQPRCDEWVVTAMVVAAAEWPAIGTTARIVVTSPQQLLAARRIAVEELTALDGACSRFRPDSEIASLAAQSGIWTSVSALLAEVLDCALAVARDTDGDVDPTMGTDLSRLGYDRDFGEIAHVPAGSTTSAVVPLTYRLVRRPTWRDVELDRAGRRVRVPAGVVIDLGAIAKAWCADRCAGRIHAELSTGVLVSLGGDIATAGVGPAGGWLVRVQDRPGVEAGAMSTIVLRDGFAVATSSTITRAWQRGSSALHHILDPATRRPADPVWRTVTVAAQTCVGANAASTASVVRGLAAPSWLASRKLTARLVDRRGVVRAIGSWPAERAAS